MSVIRSISDVAKFSGRCLALVPTKAWLITAVVLPTFLYLRSLSHTQATPPVVKEKEQPVKEKEQPVKESKEEVVEWTREIETVTVSVTGPWTMASLPYEKRLNENDLLRVPTESFNQLLRKSNRNDQERCDYSQLWGFPQCVKVVDARGLPSDWISELQTQFGSEKVLTGT